MIATVGIPNVVCKPGGRIPHLDSSGQEGLPKEVIANVRRQGEIAKKEVDRNLL